MCVSGRNRHCWHNLNAGKLIDTLKSLLLMSGYEGLGGIHPAALQALAGNDEGVCDCVHVCVRVFVPVCVLTCLCTCMCVPLQLHSPSYVSPWPPSLSHILESACLLTSACYLLNADGGHAFNAGDGKHTHMYTHACTHTCCVLVMFRAICPTHTHANPHAHTHTVTHIAIARVHMHAHTQSQWGCPPVAVCVYLLPVLRLIELNCVCVDTALPVLLLCAHVSMLTLLVLTIAL